MREMRLALAIALIGPLALGSVSLLRAQEADVSGTWDLRLIAGDPDEPTLGTLRLEQQGSALTGQFSRENEVGTEREVSGTVEGTTVRLSWEVADDTTASLVGEVGQQEGASVMAGTFAIGDRVSGEWTARRRGPTLGRIR